MTFGVRNTKQSRIWSCFGAEAVSKSSFNNWLEEQSSKDSSEGF